MHPLRPFASVPADATANSGIEDNLIPADPPPLPSPSELVQTVPAETYVWCLEGDNNLDKELWAFDEFVHRNAWKWIDREQRKEEYEEVDRVAERLRGDIVHDS